MNLDALPDDILLLIWDRLAEGPLGEVAMFPHTIRAPLLRACRRFYRLFLPHLYKHYRFQQSIIPLRSGYIIPPSIPTFTQFVLRNRVVRASIQKLDAGSWFVGQASYDKPGVIPALVERGLALACIPADDVAHWRRALLLGHDDLWISLLLILLPNLRSLQLKIPGMIPEERTYLEDIVERVLDRRIPTKALHQLTHLHVSFDFPCHNIHLSRFIPWTQLPSIRYFRMSAALDNFEGRKLFVPPPKPSGLTHIDLFASNCINSLTNLLTACKRLESFKYNHHDQLVWDSQFHITMRSHAEVPREQWISPEEHDTMMWLAGESILDPPRFYDALFKHRSTLRTLWLTLTPNVSKQDEDRPSSRGSPKLLGSLSEFTALTQLRVRLHNLLEFPHDDVTLPPVTPLLDLLPSSLESVLIEECPRPSLSVVIEQLRSLVKHRYSHFPHLKKLIIQQPAHESNQTPHPLPVVMPGSATDVTLGLSANKWADLDIEPSVYLALLDLKRDFDQVGVKFVVVDKNEWRFRFI
ncbi:hypothetical protein BO71DRAFT_62423 [Aspergillus ellipticus CBS 707.79]|uniref:Leucine-rich repeat domain-containing protein n=1 Tax=Aspergillus ellipticus CBS 707.79 TaxID=1448320 RepID=A0A319D085_9EURO|nr:hypothetical protein BO71DRAFT_62423 [Aspergillus ellipticus CBS 707.79]